jgi:hypothetical protein
MVLVPFGPDRIRVAPPTASAWQALASVMMHHRYEIRAIDTDSYNYRAITGGTGKSLHSYGIALDVNWKTNPYKDHAGNRAVRFSTQATQALRAQDVRLGVADTDMTPAMIADVRRIVTTAGVSVFEWGGSWRHRKDCMHFELDLGPDDLARGIDTASVVGWSAFVDAAQDDHPVPAAGVALIAAAAGSRDVQMVIARAGLRLRTGAARDADVVRVVPNGTHVNVIDRKGDWALVDLMGDGQADGFMSLDFLRPVSAPPVVAALAQPAVVPTGAGGGDITGLVTPDAVSSMFPATPKAKITANLPFVLAGLHARSLGDRPMVAMAPSTIRAETEGFVPISEGRSTFNTRVTPFDRYEPGTPAGINLGNTVVGDGARFKGRGYVQLTGRDNYTRIGPQVGENLVAQPERANDPAAAGLILAQFLKNHEAKIRTALGNDDLHLARKLVNGGSHGFERFADAFERGRTALPA